MGKRCRSTARGSSRGGVGEGMDARKRGWGEERGWPDSCVPGFRSGLKRVAQSIIEGVLMKNRGTTGLPEGPSWPGNHRSSHKFRSQDVKDTQPGWGISGEPRALSCTPSCVSVPPLLDSHGPCLRGGRRREGAWREREGRREAEQAGRLPAASLVLPGAGRRGAGRLARPGSSRLAGRPTGWGCWRGSCAARTIAGWRSQTLVFRRCSREAFVEVGRGSQEVLREQHTGVASAEEGGMGGLG